FARFAFAFALFAFAFPFALFLFLFPLDFELILLGQRELFGDFLAGAAGALLHADQFVVQEGADRRVVLVPDDVVELVRVFVDVVELLLAVRPLDVLVGAEADPVVVLRRRHHRGVRGGSLAAGALHAELAARAAGRGRRFAGRGVAVLFDVVRLHEGLE